MSTSLPKPVEDFKAEYPDVWASFTQLGSKCHDAGTLDEKTRRLLKVALAVGGGLEGATHSAVRNAIAKGIGPEEIKQVALLAITTLGFPTCMRALTWINDELKSGNKIE